MKTVRESLITLSMFAQTVAPFLLCFVIGMQFYGEHRRNEALKDLKSTYEEYSRGMLNSRAKIQVILIKAATEGRKLTPDEPA